MKRAVTKSESKLIPVWVPLSMVPSIDQAVKMEDSDRSKFIRNAIREKVRKTGVRLPDDNTDSKEVSKP